MVDLSSCYLHTLGDSEREKLADLRSRLPQLLERVREESEEARKQDKLTIWGVVLEDQNDASDIVLLKFIRAEELDVDKAAERIVSTLVFRADCQITNLRDAELPDYFQGHDTLSGVDVDGRPVLISRFGKMDLEKVFGDVEAFVRYRAKLMEQAMAKLSFRRGEPEELTQVHDYSGVPLIFQTSQVKGSVAAVTKVFSEHYPETKGKTIFVNFPAAFAKLFKAFSVFIPERTLKKFLILGENDHAQLFENILPDVIPEGIGGMYRNNLTATCQLVPVRARGVEERALVAGPGTLDWELRVCYTDIAYEVVFAPSDGSPEEVVDKSEGKLLLAEDGIVSGTFEAKVPGTLKCRFRNEGAWFKSR
eukprot:CAMPEP_0197628728 /NCGR_PEP_ID=MMETSP1338-20131121/6906_1 /TAXON_ID=43686 ORGANISM="Pelagodinium beii, Strain RCC1491" /NCGR_SAMPLE_ID=MMETSP1338 /ASSEMBLY_ACC=CAM_ASM_000754 /LENGTH=363 /DNA_ID=CAMNT_0043199721 /DNA_START=30 /DNA_END=1117 /DNA_ORIENTATION=+